ncbi:MAG: PEP/pyruvate-binding domain-containing protein [Thermodesulfobacteriota bacterium]
MAKAGRESAAGQLPLTRGQTIFSRVRHVLENGFFKVFLPGVLIRKKYAHFQRLRRGDRTALELIARLEEIRQKRLVCDPEYIRCLFRDLDREVGGLVDAIIAFNPVKYALLRNYHRKYAFYVNLAVMADEPAADPPYVLALDSELSEDTAGGKAATLSSLITAHGLSVPPGVVITTRAFYLFLQFNGLPERIRSELGRLGPEDHGAIHEVSRRIRSAILAAEMPPALEKAVAGAMENTEIEKHALALRSSAVGEDLQASFAGQFESRLNVAPDRWFDAYREVLASKYSPHAISYRMQQGFSDDMCPMAVLVMPTIAAQVSGILYTREQGAADRAVTYMVSGGGEQLAAGGGCEGRAAFDMNCQQLCDVAPFDLLGRQTLTDLFLTGQKLEELFGTPQDVEWIVDENDVIYIVQSRPLRMSAAGSAPAPAEEAAAYPEDAVLTCGQWVSAGKAAGRVYRVKDSRLPDEIPEQAVLVTEELPPELTIALDKVAAVLAEKGSPACHFASVAREAGIPVICNVEGTDAMADGQTVSVDAEQAVVLAGRHFETQHRKAGAEFPDTPALKMLADALAYISPLTLSDPDAEDFSIQSCRSLHDIVRYVHEAGVREMFSLVGRRGIDSYGAKRLLSGIPLVMHILDVARGVTAGGRRGKEVRLEDIRSRPMQDLFAGLAAPVVHWDPSILHYDWNAYAKSTDAFVNVEKSTQFSSYAIVDKDYLHALLRFGYHFAVLDAIESAEPEQNYIHFSFKGGGGIDKQRFLRVELIRMILEHFSFTVHTASDMIEAAFDRRSLADTGANLRRLGVVLGKTVLLDMRLKNMDEVRALADDIIGEVDGFFSV